MKGDNIHFKFSLSTIFGLIGVILGIIAIILYSNEYFNIVRIIGIILMIVAIFSSFYININKKIGFILLIIVGIIIVFYFAEFFNPYQFSHYNNLTYVKVPIESTIKHNLGSLSGIIIFIAGIIELIKNKIANED